MGYDTSIAGVDANRDMVNITGQDGMTPTPKWDTRVAHCCECNQQEIIHAAVEMANKTNSCSAAANDLLEQLFIREQRAILCCPK